jgi:hypothetical protein
MLMHLLPGLRELRAPLVSGYLWLITAWLLLGHLDWLPSERPEGGGEVARLWDLGGILGKTVVLAAISFIAYLIGSFLEIGPDGKMSQIVRPFVLADRRPRYWRVGEEAVIAARAVLRRMGYEYEYRTGYYVSQSISAEARRDLFDLLSRRKVVPNEADFRSRAIDSVQKAVDSGQKPTGSEVTATVAVTRLVRGSIRRTTYPWDVEPPDIFEPTAMKRIADSHIPHDMALDTVTQQIVDEMQQLASRLLVKNQDLYSKYDRQMAEASVRMNISIPLAVLLLLVIWLSNIPPWSQVLLTTISLTFGLLLLRQGFLRAMSARDVIVQALAIGEVESRYIPSEEASKSHALEPTNPEEPMRTQSKDRRSAQ